MTLRASAAIFIVAFIAGGCASTMRAPRMPGQEAPVPLAYEATTGEKIVSVAASFIGTPYLYGGDNPQGFDCSGLVFYSYDKVGVAVPRTAAQQRRAAARVQRAQLEPGDLVFFRNSRGRVDHVGIYAGDGRFIHSPRSGQVVSYAYLDDPYYRDHFVSAGRFDDTG